MLIHCTQKLAAKLPVVSDSQVMETGPLGSWHAHIYNIDRRQCILFCHDKTRYTLLLPGLRKEQFAAIGRLFKELFLASLATYGLPDSLLKRVELAVGPALFDRTTDRSVLGTLNQTRSELDCLLDGMNVMELDLLQAAKWLNERPVTARGVWLFPNKEILALLERV